MPRPKRSKVAPSAPTVVFPKSKQLAKAASQDHTSSPKSKTTTNSDDSDGLVKRNATGINRRGVARQEVYATGALVVSSGAAKTRPRRGGKEKETETRVESDTQVQDHIPHGEELASESHAADGEEVQVPSSNPKDRTESARKSRTRSSPRENVFASAMKRPPSRNGLNWRTQATPGADSSMVSLANFKRRPRQPSILGIGRPDDSPSLSSLGGLGEDSLLGRREPTQTRGHDFTIIDDMSDFAPDHESTPFNATKIAASGTEQPEPEDESQPNSPDLQRRSRRRARDPDSPGSAFESQIGKVVAPVSTRKRKITPPEVQVQQTQTSSAHSVHSEPEKDLGPELEEEVDDEPQLPSPKRRAVSPEVPSEFMAPPESSSPVRSGSPHMVEPSRPAHVTAPTRGRSKNNQPSRETRSVQIKSKKSGAPKAMSTATLQAYLPRRRTTRIRGEFDIHSDSSEPQHNEDEDELSYMGPGRRRTARIAQTGNKRTTLAATKTPKTNPKTSTTHHATSTTKSKSKVGASAKPSRTYSRRLSDKENEPLSSGEGDDPNDSLLPPPDDDDTTGEISMEMPPAAQKEIRTMTKKFKEVDEWEMEFEDVTASSSSPKDAR